MKIATLLFTYNRSSHTQQVIDSLKKNTMLPQKLFVFQDGPKEDEDRAEWRKVNDLIHTIDWCDKEIIVSKYNKGLAESVISGIGLAFQEYDAVIVLEDDCVTASGFIQFMVQCFEEYKENKNIYSVSGYSWPIGLSKETDADIYFCGRTSSWGWGTWKDRWQQYEIDYDILKRIKNTQDTNEYLYEWGKDLEDTLIGRVKGNVDSWGVFWALKVIEKKGYCINPYCSLIENIGFDGSGTNCGNEGKFGAYRNELSNIRNKQYNLPSVVQIDDICRERFKELYGSYSIQKMELKNKEQVFVFGIGKFFRKHEKELNETYFIKTFIDNYESGFYAGKEILKAQDVVNQKEKIIVMLEDVYTCMQVVRQLLDVGVDERRILLGKVIFSVDEKPEYEIEVNNNGGWVIKLDKLEIEVNSVSEFCSVEEIYMRGGGYNYFLNDKEKEDVVIDIGMNIGDSVIYFLNKPNVKKVYGYEPFRETFAQAEKNIKRNFHDESRYEIKGFGLSDHEEKKEVLYNPKITSGLSTDDKISSWCFAYNEKVGIAKMEDCRKEIVEIKDAAIIVEEIIKNHPDTHIILKIDCEGEEYAILRRLHEKNILKDIDFIMLEWHLLGEEKIASYLHKNNFSYICQKKEENMGLIYAWK